jgi:hypothetical protein
MIVRPKKRIALIGTFLWVFLFGMSLPVRSAEAETANQSFQLFSSEPGAYELPKERLFPLWRDKLGGRPARFRDIPVDVDIVGSEVSQGDAIVPMNFNGKFHRGTALNHGRHWLPVVNL